MVAHSDKRQTFFTEHYKLVALGVGDKAFGFAGESFGNCGNRQREILAPYVNALNVKDRQREWYPDSKDRAFAKLGVNIELSADFLKVFLYNVHSHASA